jgi:glutathione synthase/RimK-type ligase-like ATP-grasp enzyme
MTSVVLTLDTGIVHEDYEATTECIARMGGIRRTCNIYDERSLDDAIRLIRRNEVDLIETRHIRKWQQNWKNVRPIFEKVEAAAACNGVPMVPSPSMFRWNSDKAGYLREMQAKNIAITPTVFVTSDEPFSAAGALEGYPGGIVVKPSTGARSHGLQFIRKLEHEGPLYEISIPVEADGDTPATVEKLSVRRSGLEQYFSEYRERFRDEVILVQELIGQKTEYSAVMLSGIPTYYIKRLEGEVTGIGHDAFGGINVVELAPSPGLVEFVQQVRGAMPPLLRDEPIIRVDVLVSDGRDPMLLEIESGGPRLFNTEDLGNTVARYTRMLLDIARKSREGLQLHGSRSELVNGNLAPRAEVLRHLFG